MRLNIGDMAKLHNVSVQAIRYYQSIGILSPSEIDLNTGYRYYDEESSYRLWKIKVLQSTGLSLNEIKKAINGKLEETEEIFKSLELSIKKDIEKLNKVHEYVNQQLDHIKDLKEGNYSNKPRILDIEKRQGYLINVNENSSIDNTIEALVSFNKERRVSVDIMYNQSRLLKLDEKNKPHLISYLAINNDGKIDCDKDTYILKEGDYGVIDHVGDYRNMSNTYKNLLDYISEMGRTIEGTSVELLIIGSNISENHNERVTQIQILLK
ncbi:MAG: MerR family transcriptional regulator [Clostridium sp.]|uniref:MerR family transcriptional regulator n=1 Tax=Clostridium sp. TaxID=1506 RepID=UPI00305F4D97